jgi:hypothetical protein
MVFPTSLAEVIEICSQRRAFEHLTAAGSHWALSRAAIADTTFIETHDPDERHQAMGKTLFEVVPQCLNPAVIGALADLHPPAFDQQTSIENGGVYLVHVQTGKRVFQLYAELDQGDDNNADSLAVLLRSQHDNGDYLGSWAFQTLGGAGGQTVFGALTTGTHGGDFRFPPIADSVLALHLVVDGGHHYWIEPETPALFETELTDTARLKALYGRDEFRGREAHGADNFDVVRDDALFRSVLIGAGRFGVVYSVVLKAVRQYCLHEQRRLTTWQAVRGLVINDPLRTLFSLPPPVATQPSPSRFLQIAICLTPTQNFTANLAGVTKRFNVPLSADPVTALPSGRAERVGPLTGVPFDSMIQAPRFTLAGNSHPYSPSSSQPGSAADPSFLELACTNADFIQGVIAEVAGEIEQFIASNGAAIGATIAVVVAAGGAGLLALLAALAIILLLLAAALALLASQSESRLGQTLNDLKNSLLGSSDPVERAAGLLVWQMIAAKLFSTQQGDQDYAAISYAVMDGHDYLDRSCDVNVDSIEVFFDATDSMLLAFVDALLAFEVVQEATGKAFVGYLSLRFTGSTRALIGEERHPMNCVVEVAGLKDVSGVTELINFAITLALNPNFHAILHWGQRNESSSLDVERRFGDAAAGPVGNLTVWRQSLSRLSRNGSLDGFSNAFTRQTGLEVVTPRIGAFSLAGPTPTLGQFITLAWNCADNPPATTVALTMLSPSGFSTVRTGLPLSSSSYQLSAFEPGVFILTLTTSLAPSGEMRTAAATLNVSV